MATPLTNPHSRGVILVEMAIILPLLLLITFGVIEYGWMFTKSGEIVNAARHAARLGVRPDSISSDVTADIATFMEAAGLAGSGYEITLTPLEVGDLEPGDTFTVTITVPYAAVGLTGFPLPMPTNLRAEVTMAREGPVDGS